MTRGLVIGKFYPPHRGHKFLIESARQQVDQLSVIICQKRDERPEGQLRASWLREIHPNINVMLVDDEDYDSDDSALWAQLTRQWLGFVPELVFTSENYGDRFARLLGGTHISIDPARTSVPVSGSQVRTNPLQNWEFLEPCVRSYYAKRVCIIGAESTGKTTLAQTLATHYQTNWLNEYGREVSERMLAENGAYHWQTQDFVAIATTQCEREEQAARESNRLLVCDTDAFATTIWHLRYMGHPSLEVNHIASAHRLPDLYLVSDSRTPFVQDGTRDGERIRQWMHEAFISALTDQRRPFVILSGSYDNRFIQAIAAINALLK